MNAGWKFLIGFSGRGRASVGATGCGITANVITWELTKQFPETKSPQIKLEKEKLLVYNTV